MHLSIMVQICTKYKKHVIYLIIIPFLFFISYLLYLVISVHFIIVAIISLSVAQAINTCLNNNNNLASRKNMQN